MALKLEMGAQSAGNGSLTEARARVLVSEIAALAGVQVFDPTSPRQFVERWAFETSRGQSRTTVKRYERFKGRLLTMLGDMADGPLANITPAIAADLRSQTLNNGFSPTTTRMFLQWCRSAFSEAVRQGRIQTNPFEGISVAKPRGRETKQPFTWDQFRALLDATGGEWRLFILIGGLTGQRQQDVAKLRWRQVDTDAGVIHFERQKTDDELVVPMHPELRQALQDVRGEGFDPQAYVVPSIAAMPQTTAQSLPHRFRFEILPRIGIEQPYQKRGKEVGRQVSRYSYHSLRHMLSTALNAAGVSAETRMLIVGHSDRRVSAGYTHAQLADAARALEQLPTL